MSIFHHDLIIKLAARYKLPTVYYERFFVAAGGLISYGVDRIDQYRQAAGYVDRILRGRSRPTCRCKRRQSRRSASLCRRRCWRAPMK
jgi:ABC-type uncharacterized transport system substrate-binding protein